jgi:hypothetical protein
MKAIITTLSVILVILLAGKAEQSQRGRKHFISVVCVWYADFSITSVLLLQFGPD